MRLTTGLYGHEFRNASDLFGIRCGQMRADDTIHNGGWYNHLGQKLGWGDLSRDDLKRISQQLEPGEVFVVLPESASFWEFVKQPGLIGSMASVDRRTEQEPGIDYVRKHASWIIVTGRVMRVHFYEQECKGTDALTGFSIIGRNQVKDYI